MKVALQMYSARSLTEKNFFETIDKVAEIGYEGVEFAGYFGVPAKQLKEKLDEVGLVAVGSHINILNLRENFDAELEFAKELGLYSVVCPCVMCESEDEWIEIAKEFDIIGEKLRKNGIVFGYHNHSHEFEKYNGKYALDILYDNSSSENVTAEIDTYWVKKGGEDPVDYTKKYANRIRLLHAKDLSDDGSKDMEVGTGSIDFSKIVGGLNKLEWIIVEQEQFNYSVIDSLRIGFENMKKL